MICDLLSFTVVRDQLRRNPSNPSSRQECIQYSHIQEMMLTVSVHWRLVGGMQWLKAVVGGMQWLKAVVGGMQWLKAVVGGIQLLTGVRSTGWWVAVGAVRIINVVLKDRKCWLSSEQDEQLPQWLGTLAAPRPHHWRSGWVGGGGGQ